MAGKKEQLNLTKKRLKTLKLRIGKNIINYFQKKNLKKEEEEKIENKVMSEEQQIEEIRAEASAYGLAGEVDEWAEKKMYQNPGLSKLEAYVMAYNDWIK